MVRLSARFSSPHQRYLDDSGITELREETLRTMAYGVIIMAIIYDLWLAAAPERISALRWPLDLGLVTVAIATLLLRQYRQAWASLVLNLGLGVLVITSTFLYPHYPIFCGISLLVVLIALLHGWRAGFASALLYSLILLALPQAIEIQIDSVIIGPALVLIWLGAFLAWLGTRPLQKALQWAWHSYEQELKAIEALRDRQAELVQLNRSLNDACERLEIANQEIERARVAAVRARVQRDRFAASVSHEMRTPLNMIIGFTEVMVEAPKVYYGEELPLTYREDLQAVYRNACHLSQLIDDILDLAQIEAEHLVLDRSWNSLVEVVDEAVLTTQGLFQTKGLDLRADIPAGLPLVRIDRTRIRQILINLLSNAARFTRVGGVTVTTQEADHDVIVSVRDTGSGIPREYLRQIFEEFSLAELSAHRAEGGTGLGLTISKRLAELHGGNLWVESEPGCGSTFSFSLPKQENVVAGTSRLPWDSWTRPVETGSPLPTILAFTDDPLCTRLLQRHLEGYRTQVSPSASDLKRSNPSASPVAVVEVTANPDERTENYERNLLNLPTIRCAVTSSVARTQQAGAYSYLTKPVMRSQLQALLRTLPRGIHSCLVIDDDPEMVRLLGKMLRSLRRGWEIRSVVNGTEALGILQTWRPDLVFLDLLMPGVDGHKVLQTIQDDERLRTIPVIIVSALSPEVEQIAARQITIHAPQTLNASEFMRCLKANLDLVVAATRSDRSGVPGSSGVLVG